MINSIKSYWTLKYVSFAFSDCVSGEAVNVYIDCFGVEFLKNSRWGLFKVVR